MDAKAEKIWTNPCMPAQLLEETQLPLQPIETVYGQLAIQDPLAIELIQSIPFQRLKHINQYGVVNFIVPTENYTRFEHSLGVYYLLQHAKVSRLEQISGLLHDVSHTVFSHVGDYVFQEQYPGNSYQDDIHLWYLRESGIDAILKKHQIDIEAIHHKQKDFRALDQRLPYLCADRLEYNLQGGLLRGLINQKEFEEIFSCITFAGQRWIINDPECAVKLGKCSLIMTETLWGSAWEILSYSWTADVLKKAFEIGLITFDEFHFSTDNLVWKKLDESLDPFILKKMDKLKHIHDHFELTECGQPDLVFKPKFRGIDPWVINGSQVHLLTQIDPFYAQEFHRVKKIIDKGWKIKLKT